MSQPCARKNARSAIVALLPGRMTRSQTGSGSPGATMTRSTFGSSESGSNSSKLAMRARRGTAIVTPPWLIGPARSSAMASSAGSFCAAAKCGIIPSDGQDVRSSMSRSPSAKRLGSPRNLLMRKPTTIAASSGAITTFVPTICAMTPPRSMSPIRIDRRIGGAREAHVGDVSAAQIDLRRAAGALDEHEIRLGLQQSEAFEHGAPSIAASSLGTRAPWHCRRRGRARRLARRSRSAASAAPGSCGRSARRGKRALAAPGRGRSRPRPPSPPRCSTCSAA